MTYDYECTGCKTEFTEDQRISDPPITKCPKCGEDKARRLISGAGAFVLQGAGWYKDGYTK